jgi:hypothetical protein
LYCIDPQHSGPHTSGVLASDWPYTPDLFIRYGYLLWLLVYFFISNLRIDQSNAVHDLPYDVIQSVFSLGALFGLDFIVPGQRIPLGSYSGAITVANVAIIAGLALMWYPEQQLQKLRVAGLLLAAFSILVAWMPFSAVYVLPAVMALELCLLGVLYAYASRRWPAA